jgi:hypothetical protein
MDSHVPVVACKGIWYSRNYRVFLITELFSLNCQPYQKENLTPQIPLQYVQDAWIKFWDEPIGHFGVVFQLSPNWVLLYVGGSAWNHMVSLQPSGNVLSDAYMEVLDEFLYCSIGLELRTL